MPDFNTSTGKPEENHVPRWKRILEFQYAWFYDLSTGKRYLCSSFLPLHKDGFQDIVDTFQVRDTEETVYVPFLRLDGDGSKCSLMKKGS